MTQSIVSFGDSFVWGSELPNNHDGHQAWCGIIAKRLGVNYKTFATPACGNEHIARQLYQYFSENPVEDTLAIVNWTWSMRWDFYIVDTESWVTLGPTCVPRRLDQHVSTDEAQQIIAFYNRYTGDSILWNRHRSLQAMFAAQSYLKSINANVIQTYMDYDLFDTEYHAPNYIRLLQDMVKPSLENWDGKNFHDWSADRGHEITTNDQHPLSTAHVDAANFWEARYKHQLFNKEK